MVLAILGYDSDNLTLWQVRQHGAAQERAQQGQSQILVLGVPLPSGLRAGGPAQSGQYAQVERLLLERNSQRRIVRATGVSRMTVAKLAKKSAERAATPAQAQPATGAGGG